MHSLPLVTFYLTERCNSRCITCDYWRNGRRDASIDSVRAVLPDLRRLGTRVALLSGGEPLLNREWREIAGALRANGQRTWLLTSGLSLFKHVTAIANLFEIVTVSLDGTDAPTYHAIRGVDAFDNVCAGVKAAVALGVPVTLRVTLQRSNYRQLVRFVTLARELGVRQVSFLAVDVGNGHAFARDMPAPGELALAPEDLDVFAGLVDALESEHAADFASGLIAESPARLRRIHQYFAALIGHGGFPAVRCNAPEFSAVIGVDGRVAPCFFIAGTGVDTRGGISAALMDRGMTRLRGVIRAGERAECARCVCSMWRDPATFESEAFALRVANA